ncbi:tetratricopeptide repeat protein [bacterium]|nr:tetratricopeptide repeat protein [bacterium]
MPNKIDLLKEFLEQDSNDSFSRYALALELVKIGEFEKAVSEFKTIELKDENYVATYYHLGKTLERLRRKEEAVEVYKKGVKIAQKLNDRHSESELRDAFLNATMDF